jgi:gliding motility-associated-like protein
METNFKMNTKFGLVIGKRKHDSLFWKIKLFFMAFFYLAVVGVNAQHTISLQIDPGNWVGDITPSGFIDEGIVEITFNQYQCQSVSAIIQVDGTDYPIVKQPGSGDFPTTNGKILTNVTGSLGRMNFNVPGEYCDWQAGGFSITVYFEFREGILYYSSAPFPPSINVNPVSISTPFETCPSQASASQTFTLTGRNLISNINIDPFNGYEYSVDNTSYQISLSVPRDAEGKVNQLIYVRLTTGNSEAQYNGQIECSTVGATTSAFIDVNGEVSDIIQMNVAPNTLANLVYTQGAGPSDALPFMVSGICLEGDIEVAAPAAFEISKTGPATGFGPNVTLDSNGGTVWVRLRAGLDPGTYTGIIEIENSTTGIISPQHVDVNGTVDTYDCYNHPMGISNTQNINGTICAIDECYTIYEIQLNASDIYYSQFQLTDNMVVIPRSKLQTSSLPGGITIENDGRIVYRAQDNGGNPNLTLYLNTRDNDQYILSGSKPPLDGYFNIDLQADNEIISEGSTVILTANVCPSGNYTYEWFENGVSLGTTISSTFTVTPPTNGTKYHVVINGEQSNNKRIIFSNACNGQITMTAWYEFTGPYTACAIDECHTIYQLEIFNLTNNSHFTINENGKELDLSLDYNVQLNLERNGNGDPGYRNTGGPGNFIYYLNTNTIPYTLSVEEPTPLTEPIIKITPEGGSTEIIKCDSITLNASVCPDNGSILYSFKWFKNGLELSETGPVLKDSVENSGTEYYVLAIPDGDETQAISSQKVLITFVSSPILSGLVINGPDDFALNNYEHEIAAGDSITITIPYTSTLNYTLQYRSLTVNSVWQDTLITGYPQIDGTDLLFKFEPLEGAEFRVKAVDNGGCTERYSDPFLVRVIFNCENQNSDQEAEILFYENFGYFIGNDFYKEGNLYPANHWTTNQGNEYWWASDPDNYVQNHTYAGNDNEYSWCPEKPGYRIEDGYYAIVSTPSSGGCGNSDYWQGTDHSITNPAGSQGGMLFINCTDEPNTVVYSRKILVNGCQGVKVLFSAFISNATIKGDTPVNVRLDIWNNDRTRLIHSISSGNILKRNQGDPRMWANLSFNFDADDENAEYILELTNNNPGGRNWGNDIILDDISVMLCYPSISLRTVDGELNVNSCTNADTIVALKAINENGIDEYFQNPHFAFQYRNESTQNNWTDFQDIYGESIVRVDTININLNETFLGTTEVRLIVASTAQTIERIKNGEDVTLSCQDFYAIDSTFKIQFNFFVPVPIDTIICPGEIVPLPATPTTEDFEWFLYLIHDTNNRSLVASGNQDNLEQNYNTYFESLGDTDIEERIEYMFAVHTDKCVYDDDTGTPITILRSPLAKIEYANAGGLVYDPVGNQYVICDTDNSGTITATTDYSYPYEWVWRINGDTLKVNGNPYNNATLNMQTITTEMGVYEGEIALSTNCYCTEIQTIPFRIYRMFELDLDATVLPDGEKSVCLENGVINEIHLTTTTINSSEGSPSVYYWYIYQNGVPVELSSTNVPEYLYRDDNGWLAENAEYLFEVRATDGVCRETASSVTWTNTNQDGIEVRLPVEFVSLEAEDDTPICSDTQSIKYTLTVQNPRAGMVITWNVNNVQEGTITMEAGKTTYEFYPLLVVIDEDTDYTVSVHIEEDLFCIAPDDLEVSYEVSFDKVEIVSFGENMEVCMDNEDPITLKVVTTPGVTPSNYIWTLNGNPVTAAEGNDEYSFDIADMQLGENIIRILAEGGCGSDEATVTVTLYEPVTLTLVSPADPVFICENVNVTYVINVTNTNGNTIDLIWEVGENTGFVTQTGDGNCSVEIPLSPDMEGPITFSVNICSEPLVIPFEIGEIIISLEGDPAGCINEEITLELTNPSNASIVTWDTPDGIDPVLRDGKYYYTFTNTGDNVIRVYAEKGYCNANYSYTFNIEKPSVIELLLDQNYICQHGEDYVTMTVNVISGNPTAIHWSDYPDGEYLPYENNKTKRVRPLTGNEYYWANVIDDICGISAPSNTVDTTLYITIYPVNFRIEANPPFVSTGDSVVLIALSDDNRYGDFYDWYTDGDWYKQTDINELRYYVEYEDNIIFYVETTIDNCDVSAQLIFEVANVIPNIITPYNHNSKNDVFMGPKDGKPGYKVEIYNRYQQLIFEGEEGWDGTYRGKLADPGTYFYRLFLRNGKAVKGTLEVVKF